MKVIGTLFAAALLAGVSTAQTDLIVPPGTTVVYDTASGPLVVQMFVIAPGGTLRVVGTQPFHVRATRLVRIEGLLELSGHDNPGVISLGTTNIPEPGAAGGPGGGQGGTGSPFTNQSSPGGTSGYGPPAAPREGGRGGESGISTSSPFVEARRPGGGGGGVFAAAQPVHPDPKHPTNIGLIPEKGFDGAPNALGVLTLTPPPRGGLIGDSPFLDGDPTNDFFGRELDPFTGVIKRGELAMPIAGSGGGGGGDAINGLVWPPPVFDPHGDEKGAGGGGGGGVGVVISPWIVVGPQGRIRCNGGKGGGGENTNFFDRVGGGSGGGSGGYLALQTRRLDLSAAQDRALTALGGRGGPGRNDVFGGINAGGNGGPGVIALHLPVTGGLVLPPNKTLAELSAPVARVLLLDRRL